MSTTVVTPTTRARADFRLVGYFACMARQTHQPDEIVLVSEHGVPVTECLEAGQDLVGQRLRSEVHVVIGDSESLVAKRNLGMAFASGDVMLMMDDDDLYAPAYIETTLRQMRELRTPYLIMGLSALAYQPQEGTFKRLAYASGPTVAFVREFFNALGIRYASDRRTRDGQDVHEAMTLLDAVQYLALPYPWARQMSETFIYMRYPDGRFRDEIRLGDDGWMVDKDRALLTRVVGRRIASWIGEQCYRGSGTALAASAGCQARRWPACGE